MKQQTDAAVGAASCRPGASPSPVNGRGHDISCPLTPCRDLQSSETKSRWPVCVVSRKSERGGPGKKRQRLPGIFLRGWCAVCGQNSRRIFTPCPLPCFYGWYSYSVISGFSMRVVCGGYPEFLPPATWTLGGGVEFHGIRFAVVDGSFWIVSANADRGFRQMLTRPCQQMLTRQRSASPRISYLLNPRFSPPAWTIRTSPSAASSLMTVDTVGRHSPVRFAIHV